MTPDAPNAVVPATPETLPQTTTIDAPRRCFICLTDEEPSDPPGSWVDPCPCTLEAHQDCMLSWVTDCERSNKPLVCPVCKSKITLEGPWDPLVALTDAVGNKFTRASPFVLLTSVSIGVQFSMQMYGAVALWTFSGREIMMDYLFGPDMGGLGLPGRPMRSAGQRLGHALILTNIAPALLMGQLTPWLGNKIFVSTASLYGVYHFMHDETFLAWPPSPQLAMTVFPYIRSAYLSLWREFVFPFEVSLNRTLLGLPPLEPRPEGRPANDQRGANGVNRNGEGGVVAFLNNLLDALDPDDEDEERADNAQGPLQVEHREEVDANGDVFLEVVIEEAIGDDEGDDTDEDDDFEPLGEQALQAAMDRQDVQDRPAEAPAPEAAEGQVIAPANDDDARGNDVPQAPPARRPGLGSILSGVSNAIVSALILPGISFAMGELLRLALPKSWTTTPRGRWYGSAGLLRPGLLQQQWGRSLVGGCLFAVMRDVLRLYTKYRKVANMGKRKVKNVDNRRRAAK